MCNLMLVSDAKVQAFVAGGIEDKIPDKYRDDWENGMKIATQALESNMEPLSESDSDIASSSINSAK